MADVDGAQKRRDITILDPGKIDRITNINHPRAGAMRALAGWPGRWVARLFVGPQRASPATVVDGQSTKTHQLLQPMDDSEDR